MDPSPIQRRPATEAVEAADRRRPDGRRRPPARGARGTVATPAPAEGAPPASQPEPGRLDVFA